MWFELSRINTRRDDLMLPRPVQATPASAVRLGVVVVVVLLWLLLVLAVVLRYGEALYA